MIITCTVINKIPSVPYKTELVADNRHQYTVRFVLDDEWESFGTKTARVVINGTASEIDFTGDAIELPLLPSDCSSIDLGVYAGDLSTTAPVRIPVRASILGHGSAPYTPPDPPIIPPATDITLDDLLHLNDVSAGKWVKATVRQILALAAGADYTIHVVNGAVTETPADIAAALADSTRRVVLDVDGFVYDRYLYIPEPSAGEPDLYLYWQPTISGTSSIMEVRGLYLSPSAATVTERLYSTLMAVGDNVSLLVNDVGYLTEHQSLSAYRTAETQNLIDQALNAAIAAKYSKPDDGIPASDIASGVIPSSAEDVGAIAAPASPSSGAFLVWDGTAWTAQTLATWQGGNY